VIHTARRFAECAVLRSIRQVCGNTLNVPPWALESDLKCGSAAELAVGSRDRDPGHGVSRQSEASPKLKACYF